MPPPQLSPPVKLIQDVRLPSSPDTTYTLTVSNNLITSINQFSSSSSSSSSSPRSSSSSPPLALPALVHPHIHLDKAFIHNATPYTHLHPITGSFAEALTSTTTAKSLFTPADLLQRGEWLLAESVANGVTALRAFVEVDHTVRHTCLDAGLALKQTWQDTCTIQLVCFAQDPIFSTPHGPQNRLLLESALDTRPAVDVLGTTPYVETSLDAAKLNVDWAVTYALKRDKHLDFHLDYHLVPEKEPLIWFVLRTLREKGWTRSRTSKRVMCGHCTRFTLFSEEEWTRIAREIADHDLPVSFVGLPTSDIYMAASPAGKPRGTLPVPEMIRRYGLDAVIGVNNVGNAFTPWGPADPLALACLGVGVYQAGTQADAALLYECVSSRARAAIGLEGPPAGEGGRSGVEVKEGDVADLVLIYDVDDTGCQVSRPRKSVAEVVWDPPAKISRVVVSKGRVKIPSAGSCPDTAFHFDQVYTH